MRALAVGFICSLAGAAVLAAPLPHEPQGTPQARVAPPFKAPPVQTLTATTRRVYPAPEANQGAAADREHFFAINNSVIAKYAIASGALATRWVGPQDGFVRHMNSCLAIERRLWCANSNFPQVPMGSSVEIFDTATLEHVDSHSLGMLDEGSLTWFDRYRGGWIAGFAHYDEGGRVPFKDHAYSSVVTYDAQWRRTGGWLLPPSALERMAPYAASGGALGPDGWLYLLGHDRPEMYVAGRLAMGPTLVHVATIAVEAEGQAFAWAQDGSRSVFTIDRGKRLVRHIELPPVTAPEARIAVPFR